jgi:hyaluronan synthase
MINSFIFIILTLPLITYILTLSASLLLRLFVKSTFIKKNYNIQPTVSVLLSCFNEGVHVLKTIESIIANDYPMDKIEVIAIDDCSVDDTYQYLKQAAEKWHNVQVFKNSVNSGKHLSLINALSYSSGEILICIDSDTIFDKHVIKELTACFIDDTIGAVGGRVGINNTRDNILTQGQTLVYYYVFQLTKMLLNSVRNVIIISGALFAVRREHFEAIKDKIMQRNWLGISIREGEDRYMTHLVLLKGLKTYINIDAQCWTAGPNNFKALFMQQLRWRRGKLRDFFWTIRTFNANLKALHPMALINIIMTGMIILTWPVTYIFSIVWMLKMDQAFIMIQIFLGLHVIFAVLMNLYAHKHNPEQKINPLLMSVTGLWFIVDCALTFIAVCTLDYGEWGTRGTSAQKASSSAHRSE